MDPRSEPPSFNASLAEQVYARRTCRKSGIGDVSNSRMGKLRPRVLRGPSVCSASRLLFCATLTVRVCRHLLLGSLFCCRLSYSAARGRKDLRGLGAQRDLKGQQDLPGHRERKETPAI